MAITASALHFTHSPRRTGRPVGAAARASAVYRRRQPTGTPLYPVVQHHLETFLVHAEAVGDTVPHWVEDDFRAYLARRMVEVAAHLNDHVLPPLPVRQWVFSLPKRLRPFLPPDPALTNAVLRVLIRAIRTLLLKNSPGAPEDGRIGAISFPHRFGSSLNAHFHFHIVALDGLFSEDAHQAVQFHPASDPGAQDLQRLQQTVAGILRHLGLPHTAPPLTPARSPARGNPAPGADPFLELDQTPAFDPTEPDPIPDFDFDQT